MAGVVGLEPTTNGLGRNKYDNGMNISDIKAEFSSMYGEDYLLYVDAAYAGVKDYPTKIPNKNIVEKISSSQDTSEDTADEQAETAPKEAGDVKQDAKEQAETVTSEPVNEQEETASIEPPQGSEENLGEIGATFTINDAMNGVEIKFKAKPSSDIIAGLKHSGYRWSSKKKLWYAKQSDKSINFAKTIGYIDGKVVQYKEEENYAKEDVIVSGQGRKPDGDRTHQDELQGNDKGLRGGENHVNTEGVGGQGSDRPMERTEAQNGSEIEARRDSERAGDTGTVPQGRTLGTSPEVQSVHNGRSGGGSSGPAVVERGGGLGLEEIGVVGKKDISFVKENYHINNPDALLGGTPKVRFARNKAAIEAVKSIVDEGREATDKEKAVMASFSGWGSFGQELFQGTWEKPIYKDGWEDENNWLRSHLNSKELWNSAKQSIINAHYTDPITVKAMWDIVSRMGFKGGRVLEPSMGVGNFFALMPKNIMENSTLTGIELETLTGKTAEWLLLL